MYVMDGIVILGAAPFSVHNTLGEQLYEQARASGKNDYEAARSSFAKAVEKYPNDTVRAISLTEL